MASTSEFERSGLMVAVKNAFLKSGGPDQELILNGLSMKVKRNEIYALLGPSGCGKTTILKCILGQRSLNSGEIRIGVERLKEVGYMPQELGLFTDFTIKEVFHYFGRVFSLNNSHVTKKIGDLSQMLHLPPPSSYIRNLSGGEKRRVSFAVALIHEPLLLILDEPTVGIDKIISESIWEYLEGQTKEGRTVIITTHYIEESRRCNTVSLMRNGTILSECSPNELLAKTNTSSLEEAFLSLCMQQSKGMSAVDLPAAPDKPLKLLKNDWFKMDRFNAQLMKTLKWVKENKSTSSMTALTPLIGVTLLLICVGQRPEGIKIAFLSNEIPYYGNTTEYCSKTQSKSSLNVWTPQNALYTFTCIYLKELQKQFSVVLYQNLSAAEIDVKHSKVWGLIYVEENFSSSLLERETMQIFARDASLNRTVTVQMDMSDFVTSNIILEDISETLLQARKKFLFNFGITIESPMREKKRMEIPQGKEILISSVPSFISGFIFQASVMFIVSYMGAETSGGIWERSQISGVTYLEMGGPLALIQFLLLITQTTTVMFIVYVVYPYPFVGDFVVAFCLLCSLGIIGMAIAFFLSEIFTNQLLLLSTGLTVTFLLVLDSGAIWPLEIGSKLFSYFSICVPGAKTIESYRSVVLRGYSVTNYHVYKGFISAIIWTIVFGILTLMCRRSKKGK